MRILFLAIVLTGLAHGQEVWFFGEGAGIQFDNDTISDVVGGQIGVAGNYSEGHAVETSCRGGVLFYTDGSKVWNANHQIVPNGTGLYGHYSSTQACLIVPRPYYSNEYYIFTTDGKENAYSNGFCSSKAVVAPQGGQVSVTLKNVSVNSSSLEKLAGVYHQNGNDVWLATHDNNSDSIAVYLLDSLGITVVSKYAMGPTISGFDGIGQMKFSKQGDKLAFVTLTGQNAVMADFNISNGNISNVVVIPPSQFYKDGLYGVEFSPDGKKLYVSNHSMDYLNVSGDLLQFDLSSSNLVDIIASRTVIGQNALPSDLRGLQLGVDDRIYVSKSLSSEIGIIFNPNASGQLCNYVDQAYMLSSGSCLWSFPQRLMGERDSSYRGEVTAGLYISDTRCLGDTLKLKGNSEGQVLSTEWIINGDTILDQDTLTIITDDDKIEVRIQVSNHCTEDDTGYTIELNDCSCESSLFVPTGFSPNGDGENDVFYVRANDFKMESFKVYTRWGEQVFHTQFLEEGWDGKYQGENVGSGVFVYVVSGTCNDSGKEVMMRGNVTVFK